MDIESVYVTKTPNDQNIIDIFDGEWSSELPSEVLKANPGFAKLFSDGRIEWALDNFAGVAGKKILELGPMEGAHSYMLQHAGAESILSIDANTKSFLKCLCIKEIFNLHRVRYLLGDFNAHLESTDEKFDVIFASGVLYHMMDPLMLIKHMTEHSDNIFIWTHYYDRNHIDANEQVRDKFNEPELVEFEGQQYELCEQDYGAAIDWDGFCGGPNQTSKWLSYDSLLNSLRHQGFGNIEVNFHEPQHPHGPAVALCAKRNG